MSKRNDQSPTEDHETTSEPVRPATLTMRRDRGVPRSKRSSRTLLRVDASARMTRSVTRKLCDRFVEEWRDRRPEDRVIVRDVGTTPPPAVSEEWIAAAFADERSDQQRQALALSDQLIDELEQADVIVLATPMYNYGMPASLKAWFDQVIQLGRTFTFDLARGDHPLEPILAGKELVILSSVGEFGFGPGGVNESAGHLIPHIMTASKYLGVADRVRSIEVEYQEFKDARHSRSFAAATREISQLVAQMAD